MKFRSIVRAAFVGALDDKLRGKLTDLLDDLQIHSTDADWSAPAPDVVLAVLVPNHLDEVLQLAKWRARENLVVAILPFSDAGLARRALAAGARAIYALDTPLDELKTTLILLLVEHLQRRGSPTN
jgi:AmiR/NasT family two-component response regulator